MTAYDFIYKIDMPLTPKQIAEVIKFYTRNIAMDMQIADASFLCVRCTTKLFDYTDLCHILQDNAKEKKKVMIVLCTEY
jgi:hypothetical protein